MADARLDFRIDALLGQPVIEPFDFLDDLALRALANPFGIADILTRPWDRIQFAESRFALGRGAREGVYPRRYSTDRATKPQGKTASARRVAVLLACGFVARRVTERCGYAPLLAPRHKPKSPATNCILSHGLVSNLTFFSRFPNVAMS